jgi:ParB-like chromosome segregation protein Spo0J
VKEQPELKVEMVPVDQLTPYYGNAKKHPREQVEQIAKSIQEFGNCDPIAVWTNNKGELEIIEGHGRLYALDKLGIKECPVIFLDHLTDEQRRAYTHVHNQLTMNTGWDFEILEEEFQALPEFEWGDFGFNFDVVDMGEQADDEPSEGKLVECPECGFEFEVS